MGIDLTQTLLLQALGKQPAEGQTITDVLDAGGGGDADPRLNLVLQYLAQRQGESQKPESAAQDADEKEDGLEAAALTEERNRLMSELREKAEHMYQEIEVLRTRNDVLAASLGACYLCWGDDVSCTICGGRGRPGYFMPDRRLFEEFFFPAARRIQRVSPRKGAAPAGVGPRSNGNSQSSQPFERREQ